MRKFYIINNGMKDLRGHYFETAVSVAKVAWDLGWYPVRAGHNYCEPGLGPKPWKEMAFVKAIIPTPIGLQGLVRKGAPIQMGIERQMFVQKILRLMKSHEEKKTRRNFWANIPLPRIPKDGPVL